VLHHETVADLVTWARANAVPIIAIDNVPGSVIIETYDFPQKCLLLFGQEGPGLSTEAIQAADAVVEISQFGSTRSINASAAAAVTMHVWITQHVRF
jgi:tRNA G18 (ribose-2'-O)-methylase SpoU